MDLPLLEGKQNSRNFGHGPQSEKHLLKQWQLSSMTMVLSQQKKDGPHWETHLALRMKYKLAAQREMSWHF